MFFYLTKLMVVQMCKGRNVWAHSNPILKKLRKQFKHTILFFN